MAQFDVFANPVRGARKPYPYVVVLQSDLTSEGRERIVAPLAPKAQVPNVSHRLTPRVAVNGVEHLIIVQSLAAILVGELKEIRGNVTDCRVEITAALDYLFLGA
jgi:toxin CcdB